jgi:hypothetical protein
MEHVPLRDCISTDPSEVVVYGVDVLAQPHYRNAYFSFDPHVHTKCSRALPCAREEDIVVLMGSLDEQYYEWLRSLGMGPLTVVEYHAPQAERSLAEMIVDDPKPLETAVSATGRTPVYVPFYSGETEHMVAGILGGEIFGCEETIISRYFNKESFKDECRRLGIPTVEGVNAKLSTRRGPSLRELERVVSRLLRVYPTLIIRGAEGSAGSSIYTVDHSNVQEVYSEIESNRETSYLIEPLLSVIASPNDQWAIARNGSICHLGISAQLFAGLRHVGNLQGQYFSRRIEDYVRETSLRIVNEMAAHRYRGVIGIDYIVSDEGIFPVENNARMNGSSFTLALVDVLAARHGPVRSWKFFRASIEPCSFEALRERLAPILYDGTTLNCVFPYDCDTLSENGKFTPVLVAEDMYHIEHLEKALENLGVERL